MSFNRGYRLQQIFVAGLVLAMAGCGGEPLPGRAVSGRVLVEGAPLVHGEAMFVPIAPTKGPRVAAPIRDGKFACEEGPWPGEFRVEVRAASPDVVALQSGRRPDTVSAQEWAEFRTIASEFNSRSTLRARVAESGPSEFEFNVRWSPR